MVKIGHASISEKGTVQGNKGDSTGREVCTRDWYAHNWNKVLRPKSATLAEKAAKACEAGCANNNIGYSQPDRNSAYASWKKCKDMSKIEKSNTDCSAFQTLCAIAGGCTKLNYSGNAPTTSTMVSAFKNTGEYEVLTDSKYLNSSDYLKRGDVLVAEGHHTAMVLSNGSKVGKSATTTNSKSTSSSKYYKACVSKYTSLTDALESIGVNSDKSNRAKIAKANGISSYSGTAEQNEKLLKLLKAGKLVKA